MELTVSNQGVQRTVRVQPIRVASASSSLAWNDLGVKVVEVSEDEMAGMHANYARGLRVTRVRNNSPAETEGFRPGDIIVAMHGWKIESIDHLAYVLKEEDVRQREDFMFYVLRQKEPYWGQMRIAERNSTMR